MATSAEFIQAATRPGSLLDAVFEASREAVVVIDPRLPQLPIVLANATARRLLLGDAAAGPEALRDAPLHSLVASGSAAAVQDALALAGQRGPVPGEVAGLQRTLTWRLAAGDAVLRTELKPLLPGHTQRFVMLTFAEPKVEADSGAGLAPVPFDLVILDRALTVVFASPGAVRVAGAMVGGILHYAARTVMPMSALPAGALNGALRGQPFRAAALEVPIPGGSRWFEIELQPLRGPQGRVGIAVLSTEVTARRAVQRLPGGEQRVTALAEPRPDAGAADGGFWVAVAGRDGELYLSAGGGRAAQGHAAQERPVGSLFRDVHPEDAAGLRACYAELARGAMAAFSRQFRVLHRDGSYRWFEATFVAAFDAGGVEGVVVTACDVTVRKRTQRRLAQRERAFRRGADAVDGVVFEWDIERGTVHRSRGVSEVLGIDPEQLAPAFDAWGERIHPQDFGKVREQIRAALTDGRGWTTSYRIRDARGLYRSMLERGVIQRDVHGEPVRAIGCSVDVSEVKRLADLLAETQRAAKMGGWEYRHPSCEMTWTEELYRIFEADPARFAVSWQALTACCTPESRARLEAARAHAEEAGGSVDLELEIDTPAQLRHWIRFLGHWELQDGRPVRAFGSVQDIQAQKLDRIALENTSGWLKLSMNMAHMHAWRWNIADDSLEFAIVDGHEVHLPTALPRMKDVLARVHPKDRKALRAQIDGAFATRSELQYGFRLRSAGGPYRHYATVARPLFDAADRPQGLVGVTRDVTAQCEAEERLRRSEELLRATTANTADTLLLVDAALEIRFINRGVGELGIDAIIGRRIDVVLPDAVRATVIDRLRKVLRTGRAATYEFSAPAGENLEYFEYRAVRMRADRVGTGLSLTVRNVTERRRLEQEILEVSSRERHSIGRDLHDGLGQELTGIALMLRGLATRIQSRCPDVVAHVNEVVALVNQSIQSTRSLARGLLPVRTHSGGLPCALHTLAARSRDVYGLDVTFHGEAGPELELSEASASHLYRIAQEALTNASRHGAADAVHIFLSVSKTHFSLRVIDNGSGIEESAREAPGMGLKIMRYRANMIGAKFGIAAHKPRGTVVSITGEHPAVTRSLTSAQAI